MNETSGKRVVHDALEPLSELDWRVVDAARTDDAIGVKPDGIVARCLRVLGFSVSRPLTNDGLEALRRFAVRAWHSDVLRNRDMSALYAGGYSTNHAEKILAHIAEFRGFAPRIQGRPHVLQHLRTVG